VPRARLRRVETRQDPRHLRAARARRAASCSAARPARHCAGRG
jgi:hypothetical protein